MVTFDLGPLLQGQTRIAKLKSAYNLLIMSTLLGGGHIIFAFSAVRCLDAWFPLILRKSSYPIFTKFGIGVYWLNSLHGIAFGEDRSKAN